MTSVLFLDVDGVLNHRACFMPSRGGSPLCPDAVARLQRVVEVTVQENRRRSVTLLFDPGSSLEERVLIEQFRY